MPVTPPPAASNSGAGRQVQPPGRPSGRSNMTSSRVLSVFLGTTMPALAVAQAPQPQGGPFFPQVLSASSPDGSTFSHDGVVLLDHASVPAAIALPDGRIRLYYVDPSQMPENVNCAESVDAGRSFTVLGCTVAGRAGTKAVDPSIVRLGDGRFRLYYYASADDPGAAGITRSTPLSPLTGFASR